MPDSGDAPTLSWCEMPHSKGNGDADTAKVTELG
jgi:hypothetical protein